VEKDMDKVAGNYTDASNISPIFITTLWMVADYCLIFFLTIIFQTVKRTRTAMKVDHPENLSAQGSTTVSRPALPVVVTCASLYYTELCIINILFNVYATIFKPLQF
jgi:hypothetical protein